MEPGHLLQSALTRPSMLLHGASNRYTYLYLPHSNSSASLTTTYVRRSEQIINGTQIGQKTSQDSALYFQTPVHTPEWPLLQEPVSGLTAYASVSDVSAPASTNGVCTFLRPVSVTQKNKPSTMLSSNIQSIDLPMDCTAWRFWAMRQPNGCSTHAPKSNAAKQWIKELAQTKEEDSGFLSNVRLPWKQSLAWIFQACGVSPLRPVRQWAKL